MFLETASRPYRLSHFNVLRIIQSYLPEDQSIKFSQKNNENWRFWKTQFFWVGLFDFFFDKNNFFASSPPNLVTNHVLEWLGLHFYDYDGLQPRITPPKHFSRQCINHIWIKIKKLTAALKKLIMHHIFIHFSFGFLCLRKYSYINQDCKITMTVTSNLRLPKNALVCLSICWIQITSPWISRFFTFSNVCRSGSHFVVMIFEVHLMNRPE